MMPKKLNLKDVLEVEAHGLSTVYSRMANGMSLHEAINHKKWDKL